jgi:hypothetical protein
MPEDPRPAVRHVVDGMFGLPVPPEWLVQPVEQVRVAPQGIVHGDQVGASAHAALGGRLQTVQTDEARGQR